MFKLWPENKVGALMSLIFEPVTVHAGRIFFAGLQLKYVLLSSFLNVGQHGLLLIDPDHKPKSIKRIKVKKSGLITKAF